VPMPTNTNGQTGPERQDDRTFPQRFGPQTVPQVHPKYTRTALPELRKERDHVSKPDDGEIAEFSLEGLLNAAMEVATERRALLEAIKEALERRDHSAVISLVRKLCGVNDEKSGGTNPRVNGGPGI
jgi:hypothetical protein